MIEDAETKKRNDATHEAMMNPQVGDRFHEMYSHWVYVVKVTRWHVWVMCASPPCTFPEDAEMKKFTRKEFAHYYSYKSPNLPDRYWVDLCDRGRDVKGWYESKKNAV